MSSTLGEPAPERSVAPADLVGRTVLQFRVVERLGEGGMGVVYRAFDDKLRRDVALKVLSARYLADERNKELIFREARAAAALTHPNIAAIYDVHDVDGVTFLAMELVDGETLRARLARGRMGHADILAIAREIASGLARAHERGVVHRDLKPDNVMLTRDGHVKLLDFGLAKSVTEAEPVASGESSTALAATLPASSDATRAGRVMGTPAYMSPEQSRAEVVDARTDVFAFGALLYEMGTGSAPFERSSSDPAAWSWTPKQRLRRPRALATIVARCLAQDPAARYANGSDLVAALARLGRRRMGWLVAVAIAGVALALAWWLRPAHPASVWTADEREVTGLPSNVTLAVLPNRRVAYIGRDGTLWDQSLGDVERAARFTGIDLARPVTVSALANGDLGLQASGALWRITPNGPPLRLRDTPDDWATADLSPDGMHVAIADQQTVMHVRVVPATPGGDELDFGKALMFEWSPRGDALAMIVDTPTGRRLEVRPLVGGAPIVVIADDRLYSRNSSEAIAWLSPTTLAYVLEQGGGHTEAELFVTELGDDGPGAPIRVASWPGTDIGVIGVADGELLVAKQRSKDDLFTGTLAADGSLDARKLTTTAANENPVGWLPDGRLVLSSDRTGRRELYARQGDTDALLLAGAVPVVSPTVMCPDGSLWLWTGDGSAPPTLAHVAAGARTVERLYVADAGDAHKLVARADVQCVGERFVACEPIGSEARFSFIDARGLRERTIATVPGPCNNWWTVTPDGRSLVHGAAQDKVATIELATGVVSLAPPAALLQTPQFGPDGRLLWSGYDDHGARVMAATPDGKLTPLWPPPSSERVWWLGGLTIAGRDVMFVERASTTSVWWVTPRPPV